MPWFTLWFCFARCFHGPGVVDYSAACGVFDLAGGCLYDEMGRVLLDDDGNCVPDHAGDGRIDLRDIAAWMNSECFSDGCVAHGD